MGMSKAKRQMPGQPGRAGVARGEAGREPASDEACGPPREHPGTRSVEVAGLDVLRQPQEAVAPAATTEPRSGLRVTGPVGVQSRVAPDQRAGLRSRAWRVQRVAGGEDGVILAVMSLPRVT